MTLYDYLNSLIHNSLTFDVQKLDLSLFLSVFDEFIIVPLSFLNFKIIKWQQ